MAAIFSDGGKVYHPAIFYAMCLTVRGSSVDYEPQGVRVWRSPRDNEKIGTAHRLALSECCGAATVLPISWAKLRRRSRG